MVFEESKSLGFLELFGYRFTEYCMRFVVANGLFEQSRIVSFLLSDLSGCLLLALLVRLIPEKKSKIVAWLSGISFGIYLVHHTLCVGSFVRITEWKYNHFAQFGILLLISLSFGYLLHLISRKILTAKRF